LRLAFPLRGGVLLRILLRRLIAALGLLLRFRLDFGVCQVIGLEEPAGSAGEGLLIIRPLGHFRQSGSGFRADVIPPLGQHTLGRGGRRFARDAFAGQKGKRGGEGQLLLLRHAVEALGLDLLDEFLVQVGGDTRHVAAADNLDTRLFERVIGFPRFAAGRRAGGMEGAVVMLQPKCDCVRGTADAGDFGGRQATGRRGQACPLARDAGGTGLEGDLHLRLACHGAQRAGCGPLEGLRPFLSVLRSAQSLALASNGVSLRGAARSAAPR
jgi:hypothetical protein